MLESPKQKVKRKTMAHTMPQLASDPLFKNKKNIFPFDDVSFDSEDNSVQNYDAIA